MLECRRMGKCGLEPSAVAVAIVAVSSALGLGSSLLLNPSVPRHHVKPIGHRGYHATPVLSGTRRTSIVKRRAFWDRDGDKSSSTATTQQTAEQLSPRSEPEDFPPASTLIRPTVDKNLGHFLDVSRENYVEHKPSFWQAVKFRFQLRGRLPRRTQVLKINIEGELPLAGSAQPFSPTPVSLQRVTDALRSAAHDPRIEAVLIKFNAVSCSLASVMEMRRIMDYFTQSGKPLWGYAENVITVGDLCLMGGCTKVVATPDAMIFFSGFSTQAAFLKQVFEKIGVEPQVRRIGEFKSYGDMFARDSMSAAQKEVSEYLLSTVSDFQLDLLARDSNKTVADLEALYNEGPLSAEKLWKFGLIDDLMYNDQLQSEFAAAVRPKLKKNKPLPDVPLNKYLKLLRRLPVEGVPGRQGDKTVAIIIANGAIVSTPASPSGDSLRVESFRKQVQRVIDNSNINGVVIRVESPGGEALASDLMWREVMRLRQAGKVVVASIAGVAASGGYYIAMACEKIVCDEMSITGSIGVVQSKFTLGELFKKVGYNVERISRGKYAEIFATERGFTEEEEQFWSETAMQSYRNFVWKAANSRGMTVEDMNRRAQGRVWTGAQGKALGLVDEIGGLTKAIELCRDMVDFKDVCQDKLKDALAKEDKKEKASKTKEEEETTKPNFNYFDKGGPFGKEESEYTELETKIISEAKEEIEAKKAEAKKPRRTKVVVIDDFKSGLLGALDAMFPNADANAESLLSAVADVIRRSMGMTDSGGTANAGLSSPETVLLKGLADLSSPQSMQPMAMVDDTAANVIPAIGGVPKELRVLGVGPLMYYYLRRSPGLADAIVQVVARVGLSGLLDI